MSFEQFKLDEATEQTRGIFNIYVYDSDVDSISQIQEFQYFSASRFATLDPDNWFDGFMIAKGTDAVSFGFIDNDGSFVSTNLITGPGTLDIGGISISQGGVFIQTVSSIAGQTAFVISRSYDDTGSASLITEKLGILEQIEILPVTGTPIPITNGLRLTGASAGPGTSAYETFLGIFTYDEIFNLNITTRLDSFSGTIVSTVTDYNSGVIEYIGITDISQSNPVVITAPGHGFVDGDRHAVRGITSGMTEMNNKVDAISNVIPGVSFEMPNIDSTLFTSYEDGGETGGRVVVIPTDNPLMISEFQDYFTQFVVDQTFLVDGGEVAPSFFLPYLEIIGHNIVDEEEVLTDLNIPNEPNTFFVSKAGNDLNSGKSDVRPFLTIGAGVTAITNETPSQANQFSLTSTAFGVYMESGFPVDLPEWSRLYMPQSSFVGALTTGLSVINAPSFSGNVVYSITATNANQVGLLFDGTVSSGFEAKAVTSSGTGYAISIINSAANSFPELGYCSGVTDIINIDTDTTTTTVVAVNIIELAANGITGITVNTPNGPTILKGDVIRLGPTFTGGTSIQVDGSLLTSINFETIEPDLIFNAGESSLHAHLVSGDITVALGATLTVDVLEHDGVVNNSGIINGNIAGVDYGTYIDANDYLATFALNGNIPALFTEFGRIIFNSTTDTITEVTVAYRQNIAASRTVDLQIVDSDTAVIYVEATNTESTAGLHFFSNFTTPNPIPTVDTNVEIQIRDSGSQVADASANIYFTRTP